MQIPEQDARHIHVYNELTEYVCLYITNLPNISTEVKILQIINWMRNGLNAHPVPENGSYEHVIDLAV